mmetsp:Transcript_7381/g.16320  ORF Transcript_7381/g.16320 Transcript_7381/m.16320 type:complete len:132 (+) Transcript_7381:194-589(+)|eukprot:CAMPEP_0168784724 /NCGR_PEP_ID=MMETSP0725-20121227/10371_1 /TAXON_ID=265536 /ORGANISM="Amphiprora sp., Strain CCMP467" /LENGTH=131 /DNA_ID=CAMNT_0008834785 /DNA_START=148 /DNA_END=543 /DNA_ORIENTATION=-
MNLADLPHDVLVVILSQMSPQDIVGGPAMVSKKMNADDSLWEALAINRFDSHVARSAWSMCDDCCLVICIKWHRSSNLLWLYIDELHIGVLGIRDPDLTETETSGIWLREPESISMEWPLSSNIMHLPLFH